MPVTLQRAMLINELNAQVNLYWEGRLASSFGPYGSPVLDLSFDSLSLGSLAVAVLYRQASPGSYSLGESSFLRLVQMDDQTLGLYHQFPGALGPPMLFRRA